ncbi:ATP-binding cassette sub-family C member 4-like [Ptychodera flava]|uniref:ATP-binding cassette sub-family C member 4-like n=1 Tax=Ptychodera flava TaxID=63121 RepID=UPI00396A863E
MDSSRQVTSKENPYKSANPFSKLFLCWLNAFFRYGSKNEIKKDDLYGVTSWDSSERVSARLEEEWSKELEKQQHEKKEPSLTRAVVRCFGSRFMLWAGLLLLEEGIKLVEPIIITRLIDYFSPDSQMTDKEAYLHAMGVSLCTITRAIIHHPHFFGTQRIGMHVRIASCAMIYKKALKLNNKAFKKTTTGQMSNLMTNDVSRFDQAITFLHYLWLGPLQALVILGILLYEIGWACLFGYALLVFLFPMQAFLGKLFGKLRRKTAVLTDERVRLMDEIVNAMRVIKMYAWEKPFSGMVVRVRKSEIAKVMAAAIPRSINLTVGLVGNRALDLAMLVAYSLSTDYMRASTMYLIVMYCSTLRGTFLRFYPKAMQMKSECTVSLKRIQAFLLLPESDIRADSAHAEDNAVWDAECQDSIEAGQLSKSCVEETSICIENMTCYWAKTEAEGTPVLEGINLKMGSGELLGVVGPVGSGKSSLLLSLLGEIPETEGVIKSQGSLAYAAQQPWVFTGTVRQNVLFGKEYDEELYQKVIDVCALSKDLEILPKGDKTLVGERGVTLSGGQKARVNLARALYQNADIYLLDDPLSAVDSEVGRHIFERCIKEYLSNKIVILVTHQLQFVGSCDRIFVLKEGKEEALGTFDEIMKSGVDVTSFLVSEEKGEKNDEEESDDEEIQTSIPLPGNRGMGSVRRRSTVRKRPPLPQAGSQDAKDVEKGTALIKEEQRTKGKVTFGTYKDYFAAGGGCLRFTWLLTTMLAAQGFYVLTDLWIAVWADIEEWRYINDENITDEGSGSGSGMIPQEPPYSVFIRSLDRYYYPIIYSVLVVLVFIVGLYRGIYFFKVALASSENLHNAMFDAFIRAPIRFLDTNPVGRVLNRFTKDIGIMDDQLPMNFFDFSQKALMIIGILIVICVVSPVVLIITIPLIILFGFLRGYSIRTTRDVKRLDGITRSPVYSHLATSVQGLWTIRAFKMETNFTRQFHKRQDANTEAWFLFMTTSRWFGVRLDWMAATFITFVVFSTIPAAQFNWIDTGLAGLILSSAINLTAAFQYTVRQSAMVENMITSVERVVEYTKLEPEAPLELDDRKPDDAWPWHGGIFMDKLCLQYAAEEPIVLKDISCQILPREKIGIVGRTGAGKSSLITCLFRLAEPDGGLQIDGIDVKTLGLHDLRKKVSIIPQDPVLFTDSVRNNLDPFGQFDDNELWTVLNEVQLKSHISDMQDGLDSSVGESGSNLSVGQRQLVCLARAILRQNKILILDEATANVDPRTDELIQETIRQKFDHCTVLTIAHRLHTVMDSDRIMVLSEGKVVEFKEPYVLLQNKHSLLNKMVDKTGRQEASSLREMARVHHEERQARPNTASGFGFMIPNGHKPMIPNGHGTLLPSTTDGNFLFGGNSSFGTVTLPPPYPNGNGVIANGYVPGNTSNTLLDDDQTGLIAKKDDSPKKKRKPNSSFLHSMGHVNESLELNEVHLQNGNAIPSPSGANDDENEVAEQGNFPQDSDQDNVHIGTGIHIIEFNRGQNGFGFSLGGIKENFAGMPLWIDDVVPNSPASLVGKLKVGDHVLELNGQRRESLTYADAIDLVKNTEDTVRMVVRRYEHVELL